MHVCHIYKIISTVKEICMVSSNQEVLERKNFKICIFTFSVYNSSYGNGHDTLYKWEFLLRMLCARFISEIENIKNLSMNF